MTEERRRELTKVVGKMEEQAKVNVRNLRRDANDDVKKLDLPEDDEKYALDEIQKLTDQKIEKVAEIAEKKNKDVMSI